MRRTSEVICPSARLSSLVPLRTVSWRELVGQVDGAGEFKRDSSDDGLAFFQGGTEVALYRRG